MALVFIGETGIYFPRRDAIKITALDGDRVVDCYVTRSALDAIGCSLTEDTLATLQRFARHRLDIEVAAMIKYRRSRGRVFELEVNAEDLQNLAPSTAA